MESIQDLFGKFHTGEVKPKSRKTERGELLDYFSKKLGVPIARVAHMLAHLILKNGKPDLSAYHFLKSDCDQAAARGVAWGAAFRSSLKPRTDGYSNSTSPDNRP